MLGRRGAYTRLVVRLNMTWLASIVFLPLPTVLLVSAHSGDRVAYALYIGTMLVSQVSARLMETVLTRDLLHAPGTEPTRVQLASRWTAVALVGLALAISLVFPSLNVASLLLTLLTGRINTLLYGERQNGVRPGRGTRRRPSASADE